MDPGFDVTATQLEFPGKFKAKGELIRTARTFRDSVHGRERAAVYRSHGRQRESGELGCDPGSTRLKETFPDEPFWRDGRADLTFCGQVHSANRDQR
jgi:hypothetical protein